MSQHDDGGPAFPTGEHDEATGAYHEIHGMSLLDWFAGQALVGLLNDKSVDGGWLEIAVLSYEVADAMMAERAKRKEGK